jgi:hypothetical protein
MKCRGIRIGGFNADLDLESQTNADPCGSGSWSDFYAQNGEIYMKNMIQVGN